MKSIWKITVFLYLSSIICLISSEIRNNPPPGSNSGSFLSAPYGARQNLTNFLVSSTSPHQTLGSFNGGGSGMVPPSEPTRLVAGIPKVYPAPAPPLGRPQGGPNSMDIGLALNPVQSDLLDMGVKLDGEEAYNIHELPLGPDGQPVLVELSVSLRNILEIDEYKQLITVETTLRLYWRDPRLQVEHLLNNKSADYVLLHPDTVNFVWFPDIYIDFAKTLRIPTIIVRPASFRIYKNSTCRYALQMNYDVACPMHFEKYPYDTQICKVKYESYGHTIDKMKVVWKKGFDQSKVTENNYISLAQFEYAVFFEENYEEEIASGVYPGVVMSLLLRRKISYHLLQTYLPSGLFVIVAWLSLFLPPESIPGRVTMAMTTLLTLAAMFGAVRQSTPKVSYVSALDIWMCTCIIFVFCALLEYVVVLCLINNCEIGGKDPYAQMKKKKRMRRKKKIGVELSTSPDRFLDYQKSHHQPHADSSGFREVLIGGTTISMNPTPLKVPKAAPPPPPPSNQVSKASTVLRHTCALNHHHHQSSNSCESGDGEGFRNFHEIIEQANVNNKTCSSSQSSAVNEVILMAPSPNTQKGDDLRRNPVESSTKSLREDNVSTHDSGFCGGLGSSTVVSKAVQIQPKYAVVRAQQYPEKLNGGCVSSSTSSAGGGRKRNNNIGSGSTGCGSKNGNNKKFKQQKRSRIVSNGSNSSGSNNRNCIKGSDFFSCCLRGKKANHNRRNRGKKIISEGANDIFEELEEFEDDEDMETDSDFDEQAYEEERRRERRKPIQRLEKCCSFFMAACFIIFNSIYWPWLLDDADFYAARADLESKS